MPTQEAIYERINADVVHVELMMAYAMLSDPEMIRICKAKGLDPETWRKTFGPHLWKAADRDRVVQAINVLLFETLKQCQLYEREVSAELLAGFFVSLIQPINWLVVCAYYDGANSGDAMVGRADSEPDNFEQGISYRKLFGLCQRYAGNNYEQISEELRAALVKHQRKTKEVEVS